MSDTILTVIEFDNYPDEVVNRAVWLAGLYDADIELLLSDPTASYLRESFIVSSEVKAIADDVHKAQEKLLDDYAETARARGFTVTTAVSHERPVADAIIMHADKLAPRMVVKGTHYHTPAERATFAAADWQLIRNLDAPLWFVRPGKWKDDPLIIAAIDPTHSADEIATLDKGILEQAMEIALKCNGHVELVHTYQRMVEIGSKAMRTFKATTLPIDELDKKIRTEHRAKLDAFAKENGVDGDAVHQLPGRTHEILPAFARSHGANLVVMGGRSRSGLKRRMIGNTAERTLDHLPCDVLIVHPKTA